MNPLIPKIIGGTAALSALGTGTYFGAKELLRGETLREQLTKSGFNFIVAGDSEQWQLEFKSDEANITKELGVGVKDAATLAKKCKEMLDSSDNSVLDKVKKWCGIRSFSDQLSRSKKKFLVNDTSAEVTAKWTKTYEKRKANATNRSKVGLTDNWPDNNNSGLAKVKAWCGQQKELYYSFENVETFKVTEAWCTEEGATAEFK